MKTLFLANDGKIFDNAEECEQYERQSNKKEYEVELEYRGYAYITVVASSEEEAKQIAREDIDYDDITFDEVGCSIVSIEDSTII